jgi:hypothetical protein
MAESWNVKTYVDIKQALSTGKSVHVIFSDNSVGYGSVTKHKVTNVRTTKNVRELEITFDDRQTFHPLFEDDLIIISK